MDDNSSGFSTLSSKIQDLKALWDPLHALESEQAFQALLPAARLLEGAERSGLVELLIGMGRAQSHQQKLAEARTTLSEAERIFSEPAIARADSLRISWLIERSRLYVLEKAPSQTRVLLSEAWTLATREGEDGFAVAIAQMMATVEAPKAQQDWLVRAIQIAERSVQVAAKTALGSLYLSLGWKYYDLRRFEDALDTFHKAYESAKAHGDEQEAFIARWSVGKILRALGRTEEALAIQKALLSERGIGGARDGRLFEELAECLHELKRPEEARPYFELAYQELSADEWVSDNQPVKLKRLKDFGKVR